MIWTYSISIESFVEYFILIIGVGTCWVAYYVYNLSQSFLHQANNTSSNVPPQRRRGVSQTYLHEGKSGMSIISQEIKTPTIKGQIFVQFKLLNCSLFEEVVGYPCFSLRLPTTLLECKISYTYVLLPSYACVL